MKRSLLIITVIAAIAAESCSKSNTAPAQSDGTLEGNILVGFSTALVNPNYQDIQANAAVLNSDIATFVVNPTTDNLTAAQNSWRNTRHGWESCEGYLFGPVEDFNYDPSIDSWPVDRVQLDSLLASNNPLQVSDVDALPYTLKGFHAIEYIIFGEGSTQRAANITARQKMYLASLTQSLYNTTTALRNSWDPTQGNFTAQVEKAGAGSNYFISRKAFFTTLVRSMSDICDEVANSKMETPFVGVMGNNQPDSTQDESSFSHNSIADFTNNITGIRNAYLSTYQGSAGANLSQLVNSKNASLDIKLQQQMTAAITSFSKLTTTYEKAIYTQRSTVISIQGTINTLKSTLDNDLYNFIQANVKD